MKERPILFSGPMVQAILAGHKTQTRRVLKPQPGKDYDFSGTYFTDAVCWDGGRTISKCQYGKVGDRLWVRETFALSGNMFDVKTADIPHGGFSIAKDCLVYRATEKYPDAGYYAWRPSIFMPRWASRLLLEIVSVRAERVRDITNSDIYAEGLNLHFPPRKNDQLPTSRSAFAQLWDTINRKRGFGWNVNPWVWVIEFKRIT